MENTEIARIFDEIADLQEIRGDNPFRIRSYRVASETLATLAESLERLVAEEQDLRQIPGIGEGISKKIVEIVQTGNCDEHRRLLEELPRSLLELLRIPGLGPKKVGLLYKRLGITTPDELETAARAQQLRDLPGMGARSEQKILRGLEERRKAAGRNLISTVWAVAEAVRAWLEEQPEVERLEFAGSFRRRRETIGDLDVLAAGDAPAPIMERFVRFPAAADVLAQGETKSSIRLQVGLQVDLRVVPHESFGAAMQYFTGSQAHNIALRERARRLGLKVNEYGVFRGEDEEERVAGATEDEVYRSLGLREMAPELRENRGEIEAAEEGSLPELLTPADIRGDLHLHTRASDGRCDLEELVRKAEALGYAYIAVTDHSRSVFVANGLDEKRLLEQMTLIDRFNAQRRSKVRVLKGCEVDILSDGSLDLDEEVLSKLDVVLAAVHSAMTMPRDEMTERIAAALSRPCVNMFAHPTGRVLLRREPYAVDMERIMDVARTHGVVLEASGYPQRLDLNDVHCRLAVARGVRLAVNTDTHALDHMDHMRYGVFTARRGWVEKKDVINTLPLRELRKVLGKKAASGGRAARS